MDKSFFIVLEGIDGSGKGEVLRRLKQHFSKDHSVLITAEPTNSKYGSEIKELLKNEKDPLSNREKLFELYLLDRNEHLSNTIIPFLKNTKNGLVFCDRYYYSTIVYQGAQGIPLKELIEKNRDFLKPDVCFIMDLPVDIALERITTRNCGIEKFESREFLDKIRKRFLGLTKHLKDNIIIIDSSKSRDSVFEIIKNKIENLMS